MKGTMMTIGGALALGIGLILLGQLTGSTAPQRTFASTDIPCLGGGHAGAARHDHMQLSVMVDGQTQAIPANVGVNQQCMAAVHTHDASGELHVEPPEADMDVHLSDFFAVWDQSYERDGYQRQVTINGQRVTSEDPLLENGDAIEVTYTSATPTATSTTPTSAATSTSE